MKNAGQKLIKMKKTLTILFVILAGSVLGQSKKMMAVMSNARILERIMFETKEDTRLEVLFAKTMSYTGYDGKVASREEAIKNIVNSKVVYTNINVPSPYDVSEVNDSMIVKHVYSAMERRTDGKETLLKLSVESVWAKEEGKWMLFRCRIIKL